MSPIRAGAALALVLGVVLVREVALGQVPSSQTIPPGATATFSITSCLDTQSPCSIGGFTVESYASLTVTAGFDNPTLTLSAPAGAAVQVLSGCTQAANAAAVVQCTVSGLSSPPTVTVAFTTVPLGTRFGSVDLAAGCSSTSLTWPAGTSVAEVAAAISPGKALLGVWSFNNVTQSFRGYFPNPYAPRDFTLVTGGETTFICLRVPAVLIQPGSG